MEASTNKINCCHSIKNALQILEQLKNKPNKKPTLHLTNTCTVHSALVSGQ